VLGVYEKLEAIPSSAAAWRAPVRGAPALAESLAAHRAEALLFRQLATLRTDVPLTESLEDLRWRGPDTAALAALAAQWGDGAIVERATRLAQR
jgi:5'-3' exonuclease